MSATAEAAVPGSAPKGKKKLIVILAAVLALAGGGGGAAAFMMKKKAAEAAAAAEDGDDDAEDAAPVAHAAKKKDPAHAPTFVPLDPFVVNLADKDVDRFAQIGVTLEVEDPKAGEQLKAYMPAIRNGILMVLSHKTSQELLQREGKELLAREILRESMLPLGVDISEAEGASKKKKRRDDEDQPVKHVYFSNFIVQ
jgi:flagellar protein FliL